MTYYREMGAKLDYGDFTEMGRGKSKSKWIGKLEGISSLWIWNNQLRDNIPLFWENLEVNWIIQFLITKNSRRFDLAAKF